MDGLKYYEGRKVFMILKNKRQYTGQVLEVDDDLKPLIFLTILDKFYKRVRVVNSEIELIEEEKNDKR